MLLVEANHNLIVTDNDNRHAHLATFLNHLLATSDIGHDIELFELDGKHLLR